MNANAIITSVLRKLLVIQPGGSATSAQLTAGLETLNDIVVLWSANSSMVYQDTREEITVASGTNSFTLGATGDYVTGKPVKVISASLKTSDYEYPLKEADVNIYARFHDKAHTGRPDWLYFRNTHPDSTFYFDLTSDQAYTFILTSMKELTKFPDGTTEISLPDYYETALKYNLVVAFAPEMGAANRVTPLMNQMAEQAKSDVIGRAVKVNVSTTELTYINGYIHHRYYNQDYNS